MVRRERGRPGACRSPGSYSWPSPFPATASGKNVAPRVAALLDVAQLSDVTKVVSADTFERPIYAGNAIATVGASTPPKVLTRTTGFDPAATGGSAAVRAWRRWQRQPLVGRGHRRTDPG